MVAFMGSKFESICGNRPVIVRGTCVRCHVGQHYFMSVHPDSKVHDANMGPIWGR